MIDRTANRVLSGGLGVEFGTIIGIIGSGAVMIWSILLGGSLLAYYDLPSVMIVCVGAALTVMVSLPLSICAKFPMVVLKSIVVTKVNLKQVVEQLMEFAIIARRDGILALESQINNKTNRFLRTGLQLAVDGADPELLEKLMNAEIEMMADRHKKGKQLCDLLSKYAPAYGMIGTLIGLVAMLGNMSDPAAIGPGMAVALLTTLYGAVIANAWFLPIADKLAYYSREELQAYTVILQGILAIQSGDNPRVVEQKLSVYLSAKDRAALAKKGK